LRDPLLIDAAGAPKEKSFHGDRYEQLDTPTIKQMILFVDGKVGRKETRFTMTTAQFGSSALLKDIS